MLFLGHCAEKHSENFQPDEDEAKLSVQVLLDGNFLDLDTFLGCAGCGWLTAALPQDAGLERRAGRRWRFRQVRTQLLVVLVYSRADIVKLRRRVSLCRLIAQLGLGNHNRAISHEIVGAINLRCIARRKHLEAVLG